MSDPLPAPELGKRPRRLNDAHTHVGMAKDAPPGSEAAALVQAMDDLGVARAAVITPSTVNGDNSATFDAVAAFPARFVAIALVDWSGPDPTGALATAADAGARGIRFNLVSEAAAEAVLETKLEQFWRVFVNRGTVAVFHAFPRQLPVVAQLALRHPELTILVDHLGRPDVTTGPDSADFAALLGLSGAPNVSVKTPNSSFFSRAPAPHVDLVPFLEATLKEFGATRLLWGSDWPVCTQEEPYPAATSSIDLALAAASDAEREAVFADNFDRIFGHN